MDLVAALRSRLLGVDKGSHTPGLSAVLRHIEVGFRHLEQGQRTRDDELFVDAIYRANQAFEGSIKEAYRVLVGKDPAKKFVHAIEQELEKKKILRSRVLKLFTNYRQEWRNPATHDYTLTFHESEAFLALTSVSAFACVLIDQIIEHISFLMVQEILNSSKNDENPDTLKVPEPPAKLLKNGLLAPLLTAIEALLETHALGNGSGAQVIGTLHGYLAGAFPSAQIEVSAPIAPDVAYRADLLVQNDDEKVLIEVKRHFTNSRFYAELERVINLMGTSRIKEAILLYVPQQKDKVVSREFASWPGRIKVVIPSEHEKDFNA